MRYFLIKATKTRMTPAEFVAIDEFEDVKSLMDEYAKAELSTLDGKPVMPYSLFLRDEDDVLNALGRKLVDISADLNHEGRGTR